MRVATPREGKDSCVIARWMFIADGLVMYCTNNQAPQEQTLHFATVTPSSDIVSLYLIQPMCALPPPQANASCVRGSFSKWHIWKETEPSEF